MDLRPPPHLNGHTKLITCLAYLEEINKIISASDDCTLRIWNMSKMSCEQILHNNKKGVIVIVDLKSKKIFVTGGKDKSIKLYSYSSPKAIKCIKSIYQAHDSILLSLSYNYKFEVLISTGFDKYLKCFDIYTGKVQRSYRNDCSMYCLEPLNNKTIAAGCHIPGIAIFSLPDLKIIKILKAHTHSVFCLIYLKKLKILISGGLDHSIIFWNYKTGSPIKILKKHNRSVLGLIDFPDKSMFGSFGYDNTIRIWDLRKGKNVKTILQTKFKRGATHSFIFHYYASFVYVAKEKKFFFSYFDDDIKVRDSKVIEDETQIFEIIN